MLSASPLGIERLGVANFDAEGEGETHFVQRQGSNVFVIGTTANNIVKLQLGLTTHRLTVDGTPYTYNATDVRQFQLGGSGGTDVVDVFGTELNDRARIDGDDAELRNGSRYAVLIESFDTIRLLGGSGGDDRRQIFGTAGDDEVFMHNTFTSYVSAAGTTAKLSGFERVEAFSTAGNDDVSFYDTPANDRFVAKNGFSFMVGTNFWNYAKGFKRVDAFRGGTGNNDEAILYDSSGNDQLTARPGEVVFRVGGAVHVAHNFPIVRAFASTGSDTASLFGRAGVNDTLVGRPTTAYLRTPNVSTNFASGFDRIEAFASDVGDVAELRGSTGDDRFIAFPTIAELRGGNFQIEVNSFGLVRALGQGGNDKAWLLDSNGHDRLEAKNNFTFMRGTGFVNYAEGFTVNAFASEGYDLAVISQLGPSDFLIVEANEMLFWGPNRDELVVRIDEIHTRGQDTGLRVLAPYQRKWVLGGFNQNNPITTEQVAITTARLAEATAALPRIVDGNITFP